MHYFRSIPVLASLTLLITLSSCSGCSSSDPTATNDQESSARIEGTSSLDDGFMDTELMEVEEETDTSTLPPPVKVEEMKIAEEAKETIKKRLDGSPFSNLDCCDDEVKRYKKCCCGLVLQQYQELVDEQSSELGKLNLTDQILIDCKQGSLRTEFEKIDFPEEEGEDDFFDEKNNY